ncbi:hypothetical protein ACSHWB_11525 [Lentzea sp. HUAS TT2]
MSECGTRILVVAKAPQLLDNLLLAPLLQKARSNSGCSGNGRAVYSG